MRKKRQQYMEGCGQKKQVRENEKQNTKEIKHEIHETITIKQNNIDMRN